MSGGMYVVRTFPSALEAQVAQAVLEAHAVASVLLRDDAGGMMPWLDLLHPVRLAVDERDVHLAVRLLDDDAPPDGDPSPPDA